jgi:hypothetical protein
MGPRARTAAAVAVIAILALHGAASGPAGTAPAPCRAHVRFGVLPAWARAGFSDPRPKMPHVLGRSGDITAVVFGYPLLSRPAVNRSNKILWVSRTRTRPFSDLRIAAQRMVGRHELGRPVARRIIGGPGPSIVDLPAPGCWRMTLRWSGHRDELDLRYRVHRRDR